MYRIILPILKKFVNKVDFLEQKGLFNIYEESEKGSAFLRQKKKDLHNFYSIKIGLASPEMIRSWSYGRVKKPETINYRTFRPERDGLFCERIFGPTRDYECFCGKFKSLRYNGVICDRCGVEVTRSEVRRHRMGHIELIADVSHIWFFKRIPSYIALILNITTKDLERVLYYDSYIVTDPGNVGHLKLKDTLSEEAYRELIAKYGYTFKAGMGAVAIKELLMKTDIKELWGELKKEIKIEPSDQKKRRLIRRLEIVEAFLESRNKPEWMIVSVLPVIPPELRPMVQLDGGRFATSDLNDLYRRVINRNNRLERLIEGRAPEIVIRNEQRMLQEAVDALFDNGRRGKSVRGSTNRPLKSLADMLKGKHGRFRQNLLGKRVDYSGRSVIVVDPTLKLYQCGLPKRMALELFKPFIMRRLVVDGLAHNIKNAKRIIEYEKSEVWDVLEEVISQHVVLLNRAPTLHRIGIQAFEPILVEGEAIKIHPMVCAAFNADFDGDQMAVHVPLSLEAQLECSLLMLSAYNILSPAHGSPLVVPTQDVVLGLSILTKKDDISPNKTDHKIFADFNEAIIAVETGIIGLRTKILVRIPGNKERIETTVGRIIFNGCLLEEMPFINEMMDKKKLSGLIDSVYRHYGINKTVRLLDKIKELGFHYATKFGLSIGIEDIKIPHQKDRLLKKTYKQIEEVFQQHQQGYITEEERYNKIIDTWTSVGEQISEVMTEGLKKDRHGLNPIHIMVISGSRGSTMQVKQLAGMRGLMAKPSGEIIELPITSNFREGLTVLEYFISTHGARKGLADTALKTADAGYLTRRLVDVGQDMVVVTKDCGTMNGIVVEAIKEGDEVIEKLSDRILGKIALDDIINPITAKIIVKANTEINEEAILDIEDAEIERVRIRTVLTCEMERGVCSLCYGRNLATGEIVGLGEAVGIIAAQSIGEPGTQLTMRTFHIGGTAFRRVEEKEMRLNYPVEIVEVPHRLISMDTGSIIYRHGYLIIRKILFEYPINENVTLQVFDGLWVNTNEEILILQDGEEKRSIRTPYSGMVRIYEKRKKVFIVAKDRSISLITGTRLFVKAGDIVEKDTVIAEFDPYNEPILSEIGGKVVHKDIILDRTLQEEVDEDTGRRRKVVVEDREGELHPAIVILPEDDGPEICYYIPHGARLVVDDGMIIAPGDVLAKFPQALIRTKDITGGLPRIAELFEARRPKNPVLLSEIDGVIKLKEPKEGKRTIVITNESTGVSIEYIISVSKHLRVHEGDFIRAGDQITEGMVDPHEILRIKGDRHLQEYLLKEIQEVYRLQGVTINDKHIEVIIRQMLRRVEVIESGDTRLLQGEHIDKFKFAKINQEIINKSGSPAQAKPLLLGITRASLSTDSFISAASFQETTKVLTEAAIWGYDDPLYGLKENVILGKLIPAGTGIPEYWESIPDKKIDIFNDIEEELV